MNNQPRTEPPALANRANRRHCKRATAILAASLIGAVALSACGGSSHATVSAPHVAPASTYRLSNFTPAQPVIPGHPTTISFTIQQPSGKPLTDYRKCCEPHEGVDLIIVRSDDSHIQYDDSDISAGGHVSQPVVFPTPGRYRIVVDAYPAHSAPGAPINFQLFTWVTVKGHPQAQKLPPSRPVDVVDGYRFQIHGHHRLKAIEATFLNIKVTDASGRNAAFGIWRGALAHAIFIRYPSLDYFHTHVCSPGARYCTSVLGAARVTGTSSKPGQLKVGVLLPAPGTWRLFLLTYIHGRHIVAPFTLDASS
ncbi:MAG TPA: hypothetical protein VGL78_04625 [Solirubrobacteraceae bacterium]